MTWAQNIRRFLPLHTLELRSYAGAIRRKSVRCAGFYEVQKFQVRCPLLRGGRFANVPPRGRVFPLHGDMKTAGSTTQLCIGLPKYVIT
nr:MAG TPA: hypothetical protein [Caudoviricetes sp.]